MFLIGELLAKWTEKLRQLLFLFPIALVLASPRNFKEHSYVLSSIGKYLKIHRYKYPSLFWHRINLFLYHCLYLGFPICDTGDS